MFSGQLLSVPSLQDLCLTCAVEDLPTAGNLRHSRGALRGFPPTAQSRSAGTPLPQIWRGVLKLKHRAKWNSASRRHWYVPLRPSRGELLCRLLADGGLPSHTAKFNTMPRPLSLTSESSNVLQKCRWVELVFLNLQGVTKTKQNKTKKCMHTLAATSVVRGLLKRLSWPTEQFH